jgi:hypothetical protein
VKEGVLSGLEMAQSKKNELVIVTGRFEFKKIGSGTDEETGSLSVQSNQGPIDVVDIGPSKTVLLVEFMPKRMVQSYGCHRRSKEGARVIRQLLTL